MTKEQITITKEQLLQITEPMGFVVDLDRWEEKGWIRFRLIKHTELPFVWYRNDLSWTQNMYKLGNFLFNSGQIAYIDRQEKTIDL